eukprot:s583_g3.t1
MGHSTTNHQPAENNVDAYVDRALGVCDTIAGHEDYFFGNYVVMRGETVGTCLPERQMYKNRYFTPSGKVQEGCHGYGGQVSKTPSDAEILNQAKKKLGMLPDISLAGIIFFLLIYGALQERIMTQPYHGQVFDSSLFLVLCNRVMAVLCSLTVITWRGERLQSEAPYWQYALVALSNVGATACQYEALKYVSFVVQMLGKSFKMLPVMIWSISISGADFGPADWLVALLVTAGVAQFLLLGPTESQRTDKGTEGWGYAFILAFLVFDGFTSTLQEKLFKEHKTSRCNQMLYVNLFSTVISSLSLIVLGQAGSATAFLFDHHDFAIDATALSGAAVASQYFIYAQAGFFAADLLAVFYIIFCLFFAWFISLGRIIFSKHFPDRQYAIEHIQNDTGYCT